MTDSTPPEHTPWGHADFVEKAMEGIYFLSTPSHGGYWVAPYLYVTMPDHLKACSLTKNNFFEEDCSWCAVAIAFPKAFPEDCLKMAQATYDHYYKQKEIL